MVRVAFSKRRIQDIPSLETLPLFRVLFSQRLNNVLYFRERSHRCKVFLLFHNGIHILINIVLWEESGGNLAGRL